MYVRDKLYIPSITQKQPPSNSPHQFSNRDSSRKCVRSLLEPGNHHSSVFLSRNLFYREIQKNTRIHSDVARPCWCRVAASACVRGDIISPLPTTGFVAVGSHVDKTTQLSSKNVVA
ncbi:unnamed protein product [Hermetia illucens]|uniref:Uncharacterized protein n=1 Tax=Hermetia illucens TaxID=343691 RepID=A0A7R8V5N1_HERIL|nr:unnamed protein product [Hermetia illucens]